MTLFGETNVVRENHTPTSKVQGQNNRRPLLIPLPNVDHELLQIHFMGNIDEQIDRRCPLNTGTKREIIVTLQIIFDRHNK